MACKLKQANVHACAMADSRPELLDHMAGFYLVVKKRNTQQGGVDC